MPVMSEEREVRAALERIETIEGVVSTFAADDKRRVTLCQVVEDTLRSTPPVRPRIAASILGLTEKTVRFWAAEGVLASTTKTPRLLLDPTRLHEVLHLVQDLREAGKKRGLLDEVYRRLTDAALLDRDDFALSLEQMRRGEGEVIRPRPTADATPTADSSTTVETRLIPFDEDVAVLPSRHRDVPSVPASSGRTRR